MVRHENEISQTTDVALQARVREPPHHPPDPGLTRDDVDPDKIGVYGVSQAGYWVPQALAFEHRFAAAIADGGVVDVARTWTQHIPHRLLAAYLRGRQ